MRKESDNIKLLEPGETSFKRKVLVVEDNELNRELLVSFLEEKFDVFSAENGEDPLLREGRTEFLSPVFGNGAPVSSLSCSAPRDGPQENDG